MKKILTILLLAVSLHGWATNYYVKTGGNDGLSGTSDANAWATITKVNSSSFSAGDTIFFRRGDTFRGQLIIPSSGSAGNHIVFDAYGTGSKPKLFGAKDLSSDADWEVHCRYRDWETDRKSTRLNSSHSAKSRMPSSA